MNSKIFAAIVIVQVLAQVYLESTGIVERMRHRMKNEINILYRYVLLNQELLKEYREGKLKGGKAELQSRYIKLMNEHLEEKTLRGLDN